MRSGNRVIGWPPDHGFPRGPRTARFSRAGVVTRSSRWIVDAWRGVVAVVKEIFDESAYERFLAHTSRERCAESYRDFLRDRPAAASRPRCC